ncbi:hypothetical protein Henu6_gp148 [Acinetobacter phage Henu6]|uniref:Uncharacterized protein n=2 Tax=Caudoviricetes TaxID=2731619 RepID=A0A410T5F3_9CAUD|nr:hypothetical protein Henu6_gp148 [Acinetobacter phage Henu6]
MEYLMTTLDQFICDEARKQISQYEKTFEAILNDVINNLMDQIRKNPFSADFTVHLVKKEKWEPKLDHVVHYDADPNKLLFYLAHEGLSKISANASLRNSITVDKVIRIVLNNRMLSI